MDLEKYISEIINIAKQLDGYSDDLHLELFKSLSEFDYPDLMRVKILLEAILEEQQSKLTH
jgi:hypothetical protein